MSTNKKIAVIGTGNWGKNHVRNFHEIGCLEAISDSNQETLDQLKNQFSIESCYTDYKDVFSSDQIDAVVIASPAVTHFDLTKEALLAGKDVFVEKPLALNVNEAHELQTIAIDNNKILMVDHLLQYHPAVSKLKEVIAKGTLGKLQYIYSNRLNIGKLRNEENILWSFAPHDISVILSIANKEPEKVRAFGQAYLQDDILDTTVTHLKFSDRLRSHIYVSWIHPYKEQRLVVIGSEGMLVFDDLSEHEKLVLYPHKIEWINQIPVAAKADQEVIPIEDKEPLREACLHFINCIENRTKPLTDGIEAISVLNVLQQAQERLDFNK